MTGPEHYRRAEELIAEANEILMERARSEQQWPPDLSGLDKRAALRAAADALQGQADWISDPDRPERNIAEARVHAMLALAAAIAGGTGSAHRQAWVDVGAIPPGSTPATDPGHVPGSAVDQLLRELTQELRIPPPE